MNQDNPYTENTARWRRRRIRNLLGFDAPAKVSGEAQFHNAELAELVEIVEAAVENADTSMEDSR